MRTDFQKHMPSVITPIDTGFMIEKVTVRGEQNRSFYSIIIMRYPINPEMVAY